MSLWNMQNIKSMDSWLIGKAFMRNTSLYIVLMSCMHSLLNKILEPAEINSLFGREGQKERFGALSIHEIFVVRTLLSIHNWRRDQLCFHLRVRGRRSVYGRYMRVSDLIWTVSWDSTSSSRCRRMSVVHPLNPQRANSNLTFLHAI